MAKKTTTENKLQRYEAASLERPAGSRWVTMSNALTRAGHGLTMAEKRIVAAAVSKLDSNKTYLPTEVPITRLTAAEYAETYKVDMNTAYDQLQSATKNLYNRSINFFEPAHKRNGKPLKPVLVQMRWVGGIKYHEGEGWVELHWWPRLLPYLTGIKKNFTSYQLKQASALRSIYSWRLLELLLRFKKTGRAEYTIEDFCASMDATEKQSQNFNNIKRRMIEPAVKELREKDGWLIEWEAIKAGRKVKRLCFTFRKNPQLSLFDERQEPELEAIEEPPLETLDGVYGCLNHECEMGSFLAPSSLRDNPPRCEDCGGKTAFQHVRD